MRTGRNRFGISRAAALAAALLAAGCDGFRPAHRGQIRVMTTPPGAAVACNGELQEAAPVDIPRLAPGPYLIVASLPGYREARQTVDLLKDQRAAIHLALEPLHGLALVETDPPGADVAVDGAWRGKTPLFLTDVPMGVRRFEFEAPGRLPRQMDVAFEGRAPVHVLAELTPNAGTLVVRSRPEGAEVLLDGTPRGVTPLEIPDVPAGEARVEVRLDGHLPYAERVAIEAQERRAVVADLQVIPSRLTVVSIPSGARVYVGDQYRGDTPLELVDLPVGRHRVRVEQPGYEIMARDVSLAHDTPRTEEFRLAKNSGKLIVVSEPPGATVFLNGREYGVTAGTPGDLVSEPLEIDLLPPGEYRVQLMRAGFRHAPRTVRLAANEVVDLHERMDRRYVTDTRIRLRGQTGEIVREGMLLRELPNGDLEMQFEAGSIQVFRAEEILSRERLRSVSP